MPIQVTCEACRASYRVGDDYAGRPVRCRCGAVMNVPGMEPPIFHAPTAVSPSPSPPVPPPIPGPRPDPQQSIRTEVPPRVGRFTHPPGYAPESFRRLFNWCLGLGGAAFVTCLLVTGLIIYINTSSYSSSSSYYDYSSRYDGPGGTVRYVHWRTGQEISSSEYQRMRDDYYRESDRRRSREMWAVIFSIGAGGVAFGMLVAAVVLQLVLLYRMWNLIQHDGYARASPNEAIAFLYIPFFQFFWIFVAFHGLTKDLNAYLRRHDIEGPRMSQPIALAYCIMAVLCLIPYLNILAVWPAGVLLLLLGIQATRTGAAIAAAQQDGRV